MRSLFIPTVIACALLTAAAPAMAEQAGFAVKPSAARDGAGARIAFTASQATDVEVAVLDGKGQVVRHLAAGLLGANAPAPLKKDSLAQELTWDGNDDAGQPAGGPFKVRVALGVRPTLDKYVGRDGQTLGGRMTGLAVGPKGEVFVLLSDGFRGRSEIRVLGPDGKYLRTIMPYSAGTPKERTASIGHIEIDGQRLPIVFNGLGHTLHPLTSGMKAQNMAFSPKGHLVLTSAVGTMAEHGPPRHLLAMHPEGGAPEGVSFVGPQFRKGGDRSMGGEGEASTDWFDHVAVSPDGECVYFAVYTNSRRFKVRNGVFRAKWSDKEVGSPFLGQDEAGNDDTHFDDPAGVATDAAGRIYVCDRGNNRVCVFSPDGKLVGKFEVPSPEQIAVHPADGAIYVLTHPRVVDKLKPTPTSLVKFAAFKPDQAAATKELARLDGRVFGVIALDPGASPAKLWAVVNAVLPTDPEGRKGFAGPRTLLAPVTEKDGKFEVGAGVNHAGGVDYPMHVAGDPVRNCVYVYEGSSVVYRMDLATGKKAMFCKGGDVATDRDGNVYVMDGYNTNSLSRYAPDGKPLPFAFAEKRGNDPAVAAPRGKPLAANQIAVNDYRGYGPSLGFQGLAVRANGDIYVAGSRNGGPPGTYGGRVCIFSPSGELKKKNVIDGMGYGDCGLGVDAAGNMYVGVNLKPADQPVPPAFAGKVPVKTWTWWRFERDGPRDAPWVYTYYNSYLWHFGSVMKFGPEGGAFYGQSPYRFKDAAAAAKEPPLDVDQLAKAPADAPTFKSAYLAWDVKVAGMKWRYPGAGPIPASGDGIQPDPGCVCYSSDLSADEYGRVYAPNVFRFCVEMLDAAGNSIARIGRYGNADAAQPPPAVGGIDFAWPAYVTVRLPATADGPGGVYVSDSVNRRIVSIRLNYEAQETCPVQ